MTIITFRVHNASDNVDVDVHGSIYEESTRKLKDVVYFKHKKDSWCNGSIRLDNTDFGGDALTVNLETLPEDIDIVVGASCYKNENILDVDELTVEITVDGHAVYAAHGREVFNFQVGRAPRGLAYRSGEISASKCLQRLTDTSTSHYPSVVVGVLSRDDSGFWGYRRVGEPSIGCTVVAMRDTIDNVISAMYPVSSYSGMSNYHCFVLPPVDFDGTESRVPGTGCVYPTSSPGKADDLKEQKLNFRRLQREHQRLLEERATWDGQLSQRERKLNLLARKYAALELDHYGLIDSYKTLCDDFNELLKKNIFLQQRYAVESDDMEEAMRKAVAMTATLPSCQLSEASVGDLTGSSRHKRVSSSFNKLFDKVKPALWSRRKAEEAGIMSTMGGPDGGYSEPQSPVDDRAVRVVLDNLSDDATEDNGQPPSRSVSELTEGSAVFEAEDFCLNGNLTTQVLMDVASRSNSTFAVGVGDDVTYNPSSTYYGW